MMRALIRKEILAGISDPRYLVYAVLCFVLVTGSFWVQSGIYRIKHDNYTGMAQQLTPHDDDLTKGYYRFGRNGVYKVLAPKKLQMVCRGVEQDFYQYVHVALHRNLPFLKKESVSYPENEFIVNLDFSYITAVFLSLLVFIFTYAGVAGEREDGTLRLVMSYSVPRAYILWSKLVVGYAGIIAPLMAAFVGILLIINLNPLLVFTGPEYLTLAGIFTFASLYLLLMYVLGLSVSVWCRKSITAVSILLLVWLGFAVVMHNAALLVLDKFHRVPAMAVVQQEHRTSLDKVYKEVNDESRRKFGTHRYYSLPPDKITPHEKGGMLNMYQRLINVSITGYLNKYLNELDRTDKILTLCSYFSPSLLFMNAAAELANTGITGRIRLYRGAHRAQHDLQSFCAEQVDRLADNGKYYGEIDRVPVEKVPAFSYVQATFGQRVGAAAVPIAVLIILCVLCTVTALYSFTRMEI